MIPRGAHLKSAVSNSKELGLVMLSMEKLWPCGGWDGHRLAAAPLHPKHFHQ